MVIQRQTTDSRSSEWNAVRSLVPYFLTSEAINSFQLLASLFSSSCLAWIKRPTRSADGPICILNFQGSSKTLPRLPSEPTRLICFNGNHREVVCTWSSRCDFSLWSLPLLAFTLLYILLCNIALCEGLGITFGPFPLDSHPLIRIVGKILRSNLEMVVPVLLSVFLDFSINKYAHHQLFKKKDLFSSL